MVFQLLPASTFSHHQRLLVDPFLQGIVTGFLRKASAPVALTKPGNKGVPHVRSSSVPATLMLFSGALARALIMPSRGTANHPAPLRWSARMDGRGTDRGLTYPRSFYFLHQTFYQKELWIALFLSFCYHNYFKVLHLFFSCYLQSVKITHSLLDNVHTGLTLHFTNMDAIQVRFFGTLVQLFYFSFREAFQNHFPWHRGFPPRQAGRRALCRCRPSAPATWRGRNHPQRCRPGIRRLFVFALPLQA